MTRRLAIRHLVLALAAVAALTALLYPGRGVTQTAVILSTTTSTQDSGLLDVLVPMFEKKSGLTVKTISVGTGQALALAARGEADVTLAHAPALEKKYVEKGKMRNRRLVMYNDFVIVGPEDDPAKVKGLPSATYFFSSAGACASVTSASPRAASASAWPVPTEIVFTE